jgi:hypothetical protein
MPTQHLRKKELTALHESGVRRIVGRDAAKGAAADTQETTIADGSDARAIRLDGTRTACLYVARRDVETGAKRWFRYFINPWKIWT